MAETGAVVEKVSKQYMPMHTPLKKSAVPLKPGWVTSSEERIYCHFSHKDTVRDRYTPCYSNVHTYRTTRNDTKSACCMPPGLCRPLSTPHTL